MLSNLRGYFSREYFLHNCYRIKGLLEGVLSSLRQFLTPKMTCQNSVANTKDYHV